MYRIMRSVDGESIIWDDNGVIASIPMDENNRHYQEYLEWLAEGNEPLLIKEED